VAAGHDIDSRDTRNRAIDPGRDHEPTGQLPAEAVRRRSDHAGRGFAHGEHANTRGAEFAMVSERLSDQNCRVARAKRRPDDGQQIGAKPGEISGSVGRVRQ